MYSVLTRLPGKHRLSGEQVLLFLENIEDRLTTIALDSTEYSSMLREAAIHGIVGGMIYDFLLGRCALKAEAKTIYTWNVEHFRRLGPEIAPRVQTP
jgi:hypothetical protein